jgi:hypothetical protein
VSCERFVVTTELDRSNFDSRAQARGLVRRVGAELRRLERLDDRLSGTGLRRIRGGSGMVEATVVVAASSEHAAVQLGVAVLRTGIHAAGGSTAGWNQVLADNELAALIAR